MKEAYDLVMEAKAAIREISVEQAAQEVDQADLIIDVREVEEYSHSHILDAVNIPRGLLEFKMSATPRYGLRHQRIVVYCKTSGRGSLAAKSLIDMGYRNVSNIAGGFDAWLEAGEDVTGKQRGVAQNDMVRKVTSVGAQIASV